MADTFTHYPLELTLDGDKHTLTSTNSLNQPLQTTLHQITALAHGFKQSGFPANLPPPPPNSINPHRSTELEKIKKLGNEAFGKKNYGDALRLYSSALDLAASRPPWEPSSLSTDEMSILLCNRSAAFLGAGLIPEAYADAHASMEIKPTWIKSYYRLAKACLQIGVTGRNEEAVSVLRRGMSYEPQNEDLRNLEKEVLNVIHDGKV